MKALHYKAIYVIGLKLDSTLLQAGDQIFYPAYQKPWTLVCTLENRLFPLEYSTCRE